jgi:hypothetical protein
MHYDLINMGNGEGPDHFNESDIINSENLNTDKFGNTAVVLKK